MFTVRKVFRFEAAHILTTAFSKCCQRVHGHSYVVEVFLANAILNPDGMVEDFGKVKEVVGPILEAWDHKLIKQDDDDDYCGPDEVVLVDFNPTAENMARNIYRRAKKSLPCLFKIRVHETTTGWAEYEE